MNSKQDKLFVTRNIIVGNRTREILELEPNINSISETDDKLWRANLARKTFREEMLEEQEKQTLHNQLKPLLIALRMFGCFPVDFRTSGVPRYRPLSLALAYSICFYVVMNVTAFFNITKGIMPLFKKGGNVGDYIYNCLFIVSLVYCTCVPVLAWLDTPQTVQYFKKWEKFQIMFATVTEQNLVLNKKRSSIYAIIMSCIAGSSVILLWVYPPYLECWQLVCYFVSFVVMCLVAHLFGSIYRSIITAATLLNTCFKRDTRQRTLSADVLRAYRILWLRWSQLVSQMGCMMGKVFCLCFVLMLFMITISLYWFLSQMHVKQVTYRVLIDLAACCFMSIGSLYHFCNYSHYSSNVVGVEIRDELQLIAPSEIAEDVLYEVNMFLETISMNPPVVSIGGFANVDRGLFRACASTIVTYMIVLVQFDQSGHAPCSHGGNKTAN